MQVAISRWRVSVSSNQEPFLFNRQLISADNIYYQLINSTVYQTKAQQSPLSIIYMNYGFKKEKKLSILWDQERKQVKHDDTCLCLIKEQVEALCMLQDDTLCDYYSAYFWVQRSMCYTVTITFSFIIKGGGERALVYSMFPVVGYTMSGCSHGDFPLLPGSQCPSDRF